MIVQSLTAQVSDKLAIIIREYPTNCCKKVAELDFRRRNNPNPVNKAE